MSSHEMVKTPPDDKKYPQDCYSFIALNGPEKNGLWPTQKLFFFLFGLLPFVFQILFLGLLLWSVVDQKRGTVGDTDNPDSDAGFFATFVPADTSPIVRCTQVISVAAYVMFPSESLKDIVRAVQMFPTCSQVQNGDPVGCMRLSCMLRGVQGFLGTIAALLLVMISDTVVDIILNFTAMNFISKLDEEAFFLASAGEFGPGVQQEAERITGKVLPPCMYKPKKHIYNLIVVSFMSFIVFGVLLFMIGAQMSNQYWVTRILRVQFQEETGLREYSGCFELNTKSNSISFSRRSYNSLDKGPSKSSFGYCRDDRKWVLFKGEGSDPCDSTKNGLELAHSAKTDTFDISTSFDESWVSATNTQLDMYFFNRESEREIVEHCDSVLGDGICDPYLNQFGYDFDGGDCCAATCTGSNCGRGGLSFVFGKANANGIGFVNCADPKMVPITIQLNNIQSSRDSQFVERGPDWCRVYDICFDTIPEWREEAPASAYFALDCNGNNVMTVYIDESMVNNSETVMVEDGATCTLEVRNTTTNRNLATDDPIWLVDYTLFHPHNSETGHEYVEILSQHSFEKDIVDFRRIPECYFRKLAHHTNIGSIYTSQLRSNKAINWLLKDESGNSECEYEDFIERYALVTMGVAMNGTTEFMSERKQCTWPSITCSGGQVDTIKAVDGGLVGDIPSEINLLQSLKKLQLSCNQISSFSNYNISEALQTLQLSPSESQWCSTLPTEIGQMSSLVFLKSVETNITAMSPEISYLTNLQTLDLSRNKIALIPPEIGNLRRLEILSLYDNQITSIPPEIVDLTSLQRLDLYRNQITSIPPDIGDMTNLQRLWLYRNQISSIPPEIGNMKNLQTLKLYRNQLSSIPSEIGDLTNLQALSFTRNNITSIPPEIGDLTSLQELWLWDNLISSIPSEIGHLTSLQTLSLYKNKIISIPPEIGNLTNLKTLYLYDNNIPSIPSEIGNLTSLRRLGLAENNITCSEIPEKVLELCESSDIDCDFGCP